jgi:hypothetical protein
LIEGDDILGDRVNVAVRLESICEHGGILVSGSVYDHVRGRIAATFVDLGDKNLKNIASPVRVYSINPGSQGLTAGAPPDPSGAQSAASFNADRAARNSPREISRSTTAGVSGLRPSARQRRRSCCPLARLRRLRASGRRYALSRLAIGTASRSASMSHDIATPGA